MRDRQQTLVHTKPIVRLDALVDGSVVTFAADKGVGAGTTLDDIGTITALKGEARIRCDRDRIFERRA